MAQLGLVHIDAHADFRNAYQGHKHSHASVMHLLAAEGLPMASFGVRALASRRTSGATGAWGDLPMTGLSWCAGRFHRFNLPDDFPENIYVTFRPRRAGSIGYSSHWHACSRRAWVLSSAGFGAKARLQGRRCVGLDVVELAPIKAISQ
jgi:agmatinase